MQFGEPLCIVVEYYLDLNNVMRGKSFLQET